MAKEGQFRGDGFAGQRIVVIPRAVVSRALHDPLMGALFPTDAGHFPRASGHRVERRGGAPELVLIYCSQGAGWVEIDGARQPVRAGDLAVLPPGQGHAYGAERIDPWSIYWAHLAGGGVDALRRGLGATMLSVGGNPRIGGAFEEVLGVLAGGYGPIELLLAAGAAHGLTARLVVGARRGGAGSPSVGERLEVALEFMERNVAGRIRVSQLAAMTHLSPQHFTEVFKRRTGYPPIDYLLRLRLRRAMELVMTTDQPMKRIAAETGFSSQLYLSRQFRRIYGAPPTSFRTH